MNSKQMSIREVKKLPVFQDNKEFLFPYTQEEFAYQLRKAIANLTYPYDALIMENCLGGIFVWIHTPQGYDYWDDVNDCIQRNKAKKLK